MPAVFVHGNPETAAIWGPLLDALDRDDTICLSPPGFGAPLPAGFGATRLDYVAWLLDELRGIEGPIDLVGHDWGGGHVIGAVTTEPELVRSWCSDVLGLFDPTYVWHDMAQLWMTPGAGEEAVAQMAAAPLEDRTALFEALGLGSGVARSVAAAVDEDMARCILALYRSAPREELDRMAEQLSVAARRPGLAVVATDDPYLGGPEKVAFAAERTGAAVARLDGLGHWWMIQDPAAGARVLRDFWATLS